jgi:hypothetical protein
MRWYSVQSARVAVMPGQKTEDATLAIMCDVQPHVGKPGMSLDKAAS